MPSHAATKVPSTGQLCLASTLTHAIPLFHTSAQHLLQQHAPLGGHGRRHGEDELVALGSGHKGQGNAGVAAGRLNQDSLREAWRQRQLVSAQSQCRVGDGLKCMQDINLLQEVARSQHQLHTVWLSPCQGRSCRPSQHPQSLPDRSCNNGHCQQDVK